MKLLDFEVGDERSLFMIAGPCVIETQELTAGYGPNAGAHRRAAAPGRALGAMKAQCYAANQESLGGEPEKVLWQTAVSFDREGAASILVEDRPLRFRARLLRGNTGS